MSSIIASNIAFVLLSAILQSPIFFSFIRLSGKAYSAFTQAKVFPPHTTLIQLRAPYNPPFVALGQVLRAGSEKFGMAPSLLLPGKINRFFIILILTVVFYSS
jgi:hypothetical protein